ncbi:MAG: murein biosynthesis integral membrane protein MurJ [bacterium]
MRGGAKEKIAKSAGRISGATFLSRLLGIARDSVFAAFFGTTYLADAFNIAFMIPNFLRRIFGEGMLNASYVPVYTDYLHKQGKQRAVDLASKTFSVMVVILAGVTIAGILCSQWIVKAYALGWHNDPQAFALTLKLTRILFPYIFLIGLEVLAAGTLNSLGYFAVPAFAPAMLNIALVATAFTFMQLARGSGEGMITLFSVGALIGGAFQFLIQVPLLLRTGHRPKFNPDFRDPGVRWIGKLMVPSLFGFAVAQVNMLVDSLLATFLPEGSVTALRLGNRIAIQPLGIFAIAITTATLPALSAHAARDDRTKLVDDFAFSMRLILAFLIPSTVGMIVLAKPIVRVLFERGEFTALRSTPITVQALVWYSVGLVAYGGVKSAVQAFYSMKDTMTPTKVAVVTVFLNIGLNLALMGPLGVAGLAVATSVSSIVGFAALNAILARRLGDIHGREIWAAAVKILVASAAMGLVMYLLAHRLETFAVGFRGVALQLGVAGLAGLVAFLAVAYAVRAGEVMFILGMISRRLGGHDRTDTGSQGR